MKRNTWIILFLSVTGLAILMELWGALGPDPNTFMPWTSLIIQYIPMWIGFPVIVLFAGWLIYHFYYWYRKQMGL